MFRLAVSVQSRVGWCFGTFLRVRHQEDRNSSIHGQKQQTSHRRRGIAKPQFSVWMEHQRLATWRGRRPVWIVPALSRKVWCTFLCPTDTRVWNTWHAQVPRHFVRASFCSPWRSTRGRSAVCCVLLQHIAPILSRMLSSSRFKSFCAVFVRFVQVFLPWTNKNLRDLCPDFRQKITYLQMSGRGKGGKGLAYAVHALGGKSGKGLKRHRLVLRDNIQGVTNPAIRRLARRGGVRRISGYIYDSTRDVLKKFLENVIRDSVVYTENSRRKTVTAMDVVFALRRQGRIIYGFGF